MEMRYKLMSSNDPRIIYKNMLNFSGFCYYANHYDKIIRDGIFLTGSRYLNGFGQLIEYKNNIIITTGDFKDDIPVGSYQLLKSFPPFYVGKNLFNARQNTKREYFCGAVQKNILYDINASKYFNLNNADKTNTFLRLVVDDGKLLECECVDIPTWHEKSKYETVQFIDIFNDQWKKDD